MALALRLLGGERDARVGYEHWDKLRHLDPPDGLSSEEWWWAIKLSRGPLLRRIPLTDPDGAPFVFATPDEVLRLLHVVDQRCSGEIAMPEVVTHDEQSRRHYLVNSLMEEAIRSSQLEGAATSRQEALELLRTGRGALDRGEQMIVDNYRALQFMRELGGELTPERVLELQHPDAGDARRSGRGRPASAAGGQARRCVRQHRWVAPAQATSRAAACSAPRGDVRVRKPRA